MRAENLSSAAAEPALDVGAARFRLREATRIDHAAVDAVYCAFDLSRTADYRAFLEAQYVCLAPLESRLTAAGAAALLPDWPARRRTLSLVEDIAALDGELGAPAPFDLALPDLDLSDPARVLGAVYVLEGSRFGGAMLARRLPPGAPARFLGAAMPGAWRALVAALDRHLNTEARMQAAIAAARAVFDAFAVAGRLRLEAARG